MSTFPWSVEDASEEPMPVESGGEVELKDLSVVGGETWKVETPDTAVVLVPHAGGTVEPIRASARSVAEAPPTDGASIIRSLSADWKLFRVVVLVVVGLLGLAFVAVVVNDIARGRMEFQTYAMFIASFLAGRGSRGAANHKAKSSSQGDGSG